MLGQHHEYEGVGDGHEDGDVVHGEVQVPLERPDEEVAWVLEVAQRVEPVREGGQLEVLVNLDTLGPTEAAVEATRGRRRRLRGRGRRRKLLPGRAKEVKKRDTFI